MSLVIESLKEVAKIGGLEFGSAIGFPVTDATQTDYQNLVKFHVGVATIDHDMKFSAIRPNATTVTYTLADRQVGFADQNGIRVRGHNLVWNASQPAWINTLSNSDRASLMLRHIDETMEHFTTVHEWDVVNEPIEPANFKPGNLRGGPWYDAFGGEQYIFEAFKRARANRPTDRLVLNEQGLEKPLSSGVPGAVPRKSFLALVDRMLDAGIDFEVGLEGHIESQATIELEGIQWLVRELEDRKLYFRITELDDWDYWFFNHPTPVNPIDWQDRQVADQVRDLLFSVILSPYCRGVTTWELIDKHSGYRANSPLTRPLPFDDNLQAKPMALAIRDAFMLRNAQVNKTDAFKSRKLQDALPALPVATAAVTASSVAAA
jgi:endo-1,4-beta-xylanase